MPPDSEDDSSAGAGGVPCDDATRLRDFVLAQAYEPGGAAVLLFTSATLSAARGEGSGDSRPAEVVAGTVADLGLGAGVPDLFTTDAYLLQSALGQRLLPGDT